MTLRDENTLGNRENGRETPQNANVGRCEWCKTRFVKATATKRFCCEAHKLAAWKYRRDPENAPAPPPPPRSGGSSGEQASIAKARRELMARLWHFPGAERLIDEALDASLSDRQRERRRARNG